MEGRPGLGFWDTQTVLVRLPLGTQGAVMTLKGSDSFLFSPRLEWLLTSKWGSCREVFFETNGVPRTVEIVDRTEQGDGAGPVRKAAREKADPDVLGSVGAPMAGEVIEVAAKPGGTSGILSLGFLGGRANDYRVGPQPVYTSCVCFLLDLRAKSDRVAMAETSRETSKHSCLRLGA